MKRPSGFFARGRFYNAAKREALRWVQQGVVTSKAIMVKMHFQTRSGAASLLWRLQDQGYVDRVKIPGLHPFYRYRISQKGRAWLDFWG